MTRLSIIVTDSGPLITLAAASALDVLLLPELPLIVPDMVRFEVIRHLEKPGAREVAEWIRANEAGLVRVASTEVFEEFEILRSIDPTTKTKDRGEQAAAEVLSKALEQGDTGAVLIFEDSMVKKQNFLVRLPDHVVITSTSEFLFGLERQRLIVDANAILRRAVTIRGNEVLERHLRGTPDDDLVEEWSSRMAP